MNPKCSFKAQGSKPRAFMFLLVLVSTLLCAVPVLSSFTNEWGEFGDDRSNRGYVHDDTSHFDNETGSKISIIAGKNNVQPILVSFDFSEQKYLILWNGNYLQAHAVTKTGSTLYDEELISSDVTTPIVATSFGGETYLLLGNRTTVWTYSMNESGLYVIAENNMTAEYLNGSGFKCDEVYGQLCYFVTEANNFCDFIANESDADIDCFIVANNSGSDVTSRNPALYDYDLDGYNELLWINKTGTLIVSRTQPGFEGLDTGFSTDGLLYLTCGDGLYHSVSSSVIVTQLDGGGHFEIVATRTGYKNVGIIFYNCFFALKSDGSNFGSFPQSNEIRQGTGSPSFSSWNQQTNVALCDFGHAQYDICSLGRAKTTATTYYRNLACYNANSTNTLDLNGAGYIVDDDFVQSSGVACADMDTDGIDEIITPMGIYRESGAVFHNFILEGTDIDNQVMLGDVNNDNELEVILSAASLTGVYFSSFVNLPPVLNNSLNRGGYFGYANPACLDSTVTFQAQECGGTADCNYENDGSEDTERIVSTCGITGASLDNGTFVGSNPTFDCYYNATGTYLVRLYLQDDVNPTDFSQYNTQYISLLVIDGIPGTTCDVVSSIVDAPSDQGGVSGTGGTAYASDELSSVLDDLFGADTAFKNMIAVGIIIGVSASAAAVGGLAAAAIAAIAVTVLVMILGLLSVWIMVLLIALMLLAIVIGRMVFSTPA